MRRALLAALAAAALVGLLALRPDRRLGAPLRDLEHPPRSTTPDVAVGTTVTPTIDPALRRPRSLRGTRPDGGLVVDASGRFVPTIDARRLFDYFLTASGELPADALRERIVREIERRLAPEAARDAVALLDRYLAYRERVRLLAADAAPDGRDLDARLATLMALRRETLGAAAEAFFAEEEADAGRLLAARRIANDPTLSPDERAARVEALYADAEADLAPDVREARAAARLATTLRSIEDDVRARGGDDAEIQATRERLAGPEAAARLADLDRRRADWQARVDAFRLARAGIERDDRLTPAARTAAVERLLADSFSSPERLRVEALDRLAAQPTPRQPSASVD